MRKLKITSLILVVVMLVGMIPMGIFSASAAEDAITPGAFPTLPNGQVYGTDYYTVNYFKNDFALSGKVDTALWTQGWRGAEGLLLAYTDSAATGSMDNGANGQIWFRVGGNVGATDSYARAYTQPNAIDKNTYQAEFTYIYTMYGSGWVARGQGRAGVGSTSAKFYGTGGAVSWMWIPMEVFRFYGPGAAVYTEESYDFVGKPMAEVLEYWEQQNISLQFEMYSATTTIVQADWVFFVEDRQKPADAVDVDVVFNGTITGEDNNTGTKDEPVYSGLTVNGNAAATGVKNWDGKEITTTNMYVDKTHDVSRIFAQAPDTDLTNAVGVQFNVDSSKLGANASLKLRTRLQVWECPHSLPYATMNVIYNDYMQKHSGDGRHAVLLPDVYEVFSSDSTKGVSGGYVQLTNRSGDAVAYLTGTDEAGNTYENTLVHVDAPQNTKGGDMNTATTHEDMFQLPAGFVGEVYIPMDSYWINVYGSYSSNCLIPFDGELFPELDSIALASVIAGTPETNEVTYSDFKIVNAAPVEVIEIGSVEEYMNDFIGQMKAKNDFTGKIVRLTADLDFTDKTYAVDNDLRFGGTFDGNGHVIRNLTVTGSNYVGILGNISADRQVLVKDLTFLNCAVNTSGHTNGGIFGVVWGDSLTKPVHDIESYYSSSKTSFNNVYANIDVTTSQAVSGGAGIGGFIGGLKGDAEFVDCVYTGTVSSQGRGVGGLLGFVLQKEEAYNSQTCQWFKLRVDVKNTVVMATLRGNQFLGGIAGYSQSNILTYDIEDTYIIPTFQAKDGAATANGGSIAGGGYSTGANRTKALKAGNNGCNDRQVIKLSDVYAVTSVNITEGGQGASVATTTSNGMAAPSHGTGKGNTAPNVELSALPEVLLVRDGAIKQSVSITEDFALTASVKNYDVIVRPDMVNTLTETKISMAINGQPATLVEIEEGYAATFEDILPQEINNNIAITYKVGSTNVTKNTTVESYLRGLLTSDDENLVAFVADTLRYARATQDFFGAQITKKVNTSNLPAGSDLDREAIVEEYAYELFADEAFTGVALMLDGQLAVQIGVVDPAMTYAADLEGTELDVVVAEDNCILVYITPNALELTLTVTAENGDEVAFYISDYIGFALSMEISDAQANVLVALFNYMASAATYNPPVVVE